jgi:hypothetical protein
MFWKQSMILMHLLNAMCRLKRSIIFLPLGLRVNRGMALLVEK